eukprot:2644115-Prymnesium_polylepis.1
MAYEHMVITRLPASVPSLSRSHSSCPALTPAKTPSDAPRRLDKSLNVESPKNSRAPTMPPSSISSDRQRSESTVRRVYKPRPLERDSGQFASQGPSARVPRTIPRRPLPWSRAFFAGPACRHVLRHLTPSNGVRSIARMSRGLDGPEAASTG